MKKEYTNEMIDRIMSVAVPSFCYREKEVTTHVQRHGYINLGNQTFSFFYCYDDCLEYFIEDEAFDLQSAIDYGDVILAKFNDIIKFAFEEYGLSLYKFDPISKSPILQLYL